MTENNMYFIEINGTELDNHINTEDTDASFPFEFSHTNVWNQSFLPPENSSTVFETLFVELADIKQLLTEIKNFLLETF